MCGTNSNVSQGEFITPPHHSGRSGNDSETTEVSRNLFFLIFSISRRYYRNMKSRNLQLARQLSCKFWLQFG